MKKIFKIVVIICPLINMGMIAFLAERNPSSEIKKEELKNAGIEQLSNAVHFVNVNTSSVEDRFDVANIRSSRRSYFIEHEE